MSKKNKSRWYQDKMNGLPPSNKVEDEPVPSEESVVQISIEPETEVLPGIVPPYIPGGEMADTEPVEMTPEDREDEVYVITTPLSLNIRKEPRKNADILRVVPQGTPLACISDIDGWAHVHTAEQPPLEGYVMSMFLEPRDK